MVVCAVVLKHFAAMVPVVVRAGSAFTVTAEVELFEHPVARLVTVYTILTLPEATPVTKPEAFTVAIAALELLQTPPAVALDNVVDEPTHSTVDPVFAVMEGNAVTMTEAVFVQALLLVYVITLLPAETPVTNPLELTVATAGVADIQALDDAAVPDPVNWVFDPAQTVRVPVMVGNAFIVSDTALVAVLLPFEIVIVPL